MLKELNELSVKYPCQFLALVLIIGWAVAS